ncbi:MAG TPA: hypothetical protein VK184_02110 [Nostocaceae cyanobacterium]|nr:hypothetical protein [Nostocaceae cyanobacterium]
MLCLKSFDQADLFDPEELEAKEGIFSKYKYALAYIGVDFSQEDVQEALLNCFDGFENAIRATIVYWYWLEKNSKPFYPNPCIIQAMKERWSPPYWQDSYLENPNFQSPCHVFWEEARKVWGFDLRNQLIADINSDERGFEYVMLRNGKTISLSGAKRLGWEKLQELAIQKY